MDEACHRLSVRQSSGQPFHLESAPKQNKRNVGKGRVEVGVVTRFLSLSLAKEGNPTGRGESEIDTDSRECATRIGRKVRGLHYDKRPSDRAGIAESSRLLLAMPRHLGKRI